MHRFRSKTYAMVVSAAVLLAASLAHAQERGPLTLASASYFFVGGKIDTSAEGSPMVGHIYVEYMIPARRSHPYPIVMVHGGSQTGTNFTGTPDGREGWAQYFVRRGYAVYVVDQVARGRSAYWTPQPYGAVTPSRRIASASSRVATPSSAAPAASAALATWVAPWPYPSAFNTTITWAEPACSRRRRTLCAMASRSTTACAAGFDVVSWVVCMVMSPPSIVPEGGSGGRRG